MASEARTLPASGAARGRGRGARDRGATCGYCVGAEQRAAYVAVAEPVSVAVAVAVSSNVGARGDRNARPARS